jgi:hypothetical protein
MTTSNVLKLANDQLDQLIIDLLTKQSPKFYSFDQINSGGSDVIDLKQGIDYCVVVQAFDADDANARACNIGVYFDGVNAGRDCECCGDRWRPCYDADGSDHHDNTWRDSYTVHFLDGSIVRFEKYHL